MQSRRMSVAAKFPWPLQDEPSQDRLPPRADAGPDLGLDPKAEPCPRLGIAPLASVNHPLEDELPEQEIQKNELARMEGRKKGGSQNAILQYHLPENILEIEPAARSPRPTDGLESVGRLVGAVAHDFNNLLTGILLYCDLLLALKPDERACKYTEEIRNAGLQAAGLVRQLLAVARPSNGDSVPLSLNEIAEGMRSLLDRLIGEDITLHFRLDPTLGWVKMDPTQAQQVLLNLALNARDALPTGGEIVVSTRNCKIQVLTDAPPGAGPVTSLPCALFMVEDNGSGMDAATQARVFEVFFTTKPAGKGTGLGLATVHDIVTANGGLIHVDSAPDRGTRVTVLLPLIPRTALNSQRRTDAPEPHKPETQKTEGVLPAKKKQEKEKKP